MGSSFSNKFASYAFSGLLRQFGESLQYFHVSASDPITTTAIVDQNPPERYDQRGNVWLPSAEIQLKDGKDGLYLSSVDTGGDYVVLRNWRSEEQTTFSVVQVISFDSGVIHLALR